MTLRYSKAGQFVAMTLIIFKIVPSPDVAEADDIERGQQGAIPGDGYDRFARNFVVRDVSVLRLPREAFHGTS